MAFYLSVDVGGTNIKYGLMNDQAEILEKDEYPTPMDGGLDAFVSGLKKIYDRYSDQVEALVMSAPGKIDSRTGYFYTSGALQYIDQTNLGDKLKEAGIDIPFAVENDAKAAALAEMWKGSMKGIRNGVVMVLGTGIGGAVIINGELYRGSTFSAGEFSGMPLHLNQFPYDMNKMWALQNGVGYMVEDYAERTGKDLSGLNGRILFDDANHGNEDALASIDHYCEGLAAGIMSLQFALDVQRFAIGGGISRQPLLIKSLRQKTDEYYASADGMPASVPEIVPCTFGNDANMIGALYHYLYELKKKTPEE